MQSKRAELVPIAEVVSLLGGPVAAIRDATPQAMHHFTRADQVNQLVSASEAAPALGFMARTMALCSACPAPTPATANSTSESQRPVHAHHDGHRKLQAALRQPGRAC